MMAVGSGPLTVATERPEVIFIAPGAGLPKGLGMFGATS